LAASLTSVEKEFLKTKRLLLESQEAFDKQKIVTEQKITVSGFLFFNLSHFLGIGD